MLVVADWRDIPSLIRKDYWPNGDISPGPNGVDATSTGFAVHYASLIPVKGQSDVELLAKVKIDTLVAKQGLLVIRGNIFFDRQQNHNRDSGYIVAYQQGVDGITYLKVDYADGTFNQAIGVSKPLEWNWVRFSVKGSEIKAKVWADGQVEPGWQIVINDTYWPADSNGSVGIAHFSGGNVTYNYISASTDDRPAPKPGDYVDTYVNSKPEPELGYWGAPGLRPLGLLQIPKKKTTNYDIAGNTTTARITTNLPTLSHKYSLRGNRGFPWVAIKSPIVTYKEPGKLYILPSTEVARVKISQPTLNYKAPPNTNIVGKTTTARVTTSLPSITFSSKHAIIADETVARIELPQPTIVFKDVERYTFYVDTVTAHIHTTLPSIRFKRVQINPDVWSTPQQRIEQEWRKLPVSSEATGTWRQHGYIRSNDQVWRDRRREDASQWRKPVSTTRDEQEWRRVVYD
nr:MAG TPA: hypothetical protein [Caudoviricetes sp.]